MTFDVRFSAGALADLERLHEYLLTRAEFREDLDLADRAIDEIEVSCKAQLGRTPYLYRRIGRSLTRRELVIPFGAAGYVAQYEILSPSLVLVLGIRHQLEGDFH